MEELILTSFDTIIGENFEEMTVDDFLGKINDNLDMEAYDINYAEGSEGFNIIFSKKKYLLKLDKTVMDNYNRGMYNDLTVRIQEMINKRNEERRQEIIETDKLTGKLPDTEDDMKLYLDYLKEQRKEFSSSKKYFKGILKDFTKKDKDGYSFIRFVLSLWFFTQLLWAFIIFFSYVLRFLDTSSVSELTNFILDNICYDIIIGGGSCSLLLTATMGTIGYSKIRKERKECEDNARKVLDSKISTIEKALSKKNSRPISEEEFGKTLPSDTLESPTKQKIEDPILRNIYDDLDRIRYINPEDKTNLLVEIKQIHKLYIERLNSINAGNTNDNIEKLKSDIATKLGMLEFKMSCIRNNDIKRDETNNETLKTATSSPASEEKKKKKARTHQI